MAYLKRNWMMVALAVAAVAGLGVAVWQGMAAFDVPQQMQPAVNTGRDLQNLKGKGANTTWIEDIKRWNGEILKRQDEEAKKVENRQRTVAFAAPIGPDGKLGAAPERKPLGGEHPQVDAQGHPVL